jgi:hypothetical protein
MVLRGKPALSSERRQMLDFRTSKRKALDVVQGFFRECEEGLC